MRFKGGRWPHHSLRVLALQMELVAGMNLRASACVIVFGNTKVFALEPELDPADVFCFCCEEFTL